MGSTTRARCANGAGTSINSLVRIPKLRFNRDTHRRFEANFKGPIVAELQERYPQLRDAGALEAFKRKWRYMFTYAEVGYARAYTNLNCWTFTRPVGDSLGHGVVCVDADDVRRRTL